MDRFWTTDSKLVKELYQTFRQHADQICDNHSTVSLTPYAVQVLHDSFCRISNSDVKNPKFDVLPSMFNEFDIYRELLFLFDIAQTATDLIILQTDNTLRGCISLASFIRVCKLELNCLPIQYIRGLGTLRSTLCHLVCIGCFENLEDLFISCGADKLEDGRDWPALREVHLPYNNLRYLDSSLSKLKDLRLLDLSHNNITGTDTFLQSLVHLQTLNLSFNELKSFTVVRLSNLTSLNLRCNLLSSINDVGNLINLESLDVSHNLLSSHQRLHCIHSLEKLNQLIIVGNPLCHVKDHRKLTIACVNPKAVSKFLLDGESPTICELRYYKSAASTRPRQLLGTAPQQQPVSNVTPRLQRNETSTPQTTGQRTVPTVATGNSVTSVATPKKKYKKKCRLRVVHIDEPGQHSAPNSDQDWLVVSTDYLTSSVTSSLPSGSSHLQGLDRVDGLRLPADAIAEGDEISHLLEHRRKSDRRKAKNLSQAVADIKTAEFTDTTGAAVVGDEQVEVQFPGNRLLSPTNDVSAAIGSFGAKSTSVNCSDIGLLQKLSLEDERSTADSGQSVSERGDDQPVDIVAPVDDTVDASPQPAQKTDSASESDVQRTQDTAAAADDVSDVIDIYKTSSTAVPADLTATSKRFSTPEDLESCCTIYCPLTRSHCFVNTNSTHFLVIDIGNGLPIIDEFSLTSLASMQIVADNYELAADEQAETVKCRGPVLKLIFDGTRGSTIDLTYVMFDLDETANLQKKLEPYINARRKMLECIKCSQRFLDSQANRMVKAVADTERYYTSFRMDPLVEVAVCPYCSSDLVFDIPSDGNVPPPGLQSGASVHSLAGASSSSLSGAGIPRVSSAVGLATAGAGSLPFSPINVAHGSLDAIKLAAGPPACKPVAADDDGCLISTDVGNARAGSLERPPSTDSPFAASTTNLNDPVPDSTAELFPQVANEDVEHCNGYNFYNNDFKRFDHRLNLEINLNIFKDDEEKLLLLVKSPLELVSKGVSSLFDGVLMISSSSVYVAQLNTSCSGETSFNSWFKVRCQHAASHPLSVTVGFRGQTVTIDSPTINCKLLICDVDWCKRLVQAMLDLYNEHRLPIMLGVCAKDRQSLNIVMQQLCDQFDWNMEKRPYLHGYAISQGYQKSVNKVSEKVSRDAVGVLVTMTHVCVVHETVSSFDRVAGVAVDCPEGTVDFTVVEQQPMNDVVNMDVSSTNPWKVTIYFEKEIDHVPISWGLVFRNSSSVKEFIEAMQESYYTVFSVPLQVKRNYSLLTGSST